MFSGHAGGAFLKISWEVALPFEQLFVIRRGDFFSRKLMLPLALGARPVFWHLGRFFGCCRFRDRAA